MAPPFSLLLRYLLCAGAALPALLRGQGEPDYEKPPVEYSATTPQDAVSRLAAKLDLGAAGIAGNERQQLRAVLAALEVPVASQMLVFSKTSLQRGRIRPAQPRAIYFSDSVYVGWVPGGLIEIAAIDPRLGPIFYTFDPRRTAHNAAAFTREADCLRCHGGVFVRDIPGVFARSVVASDTGEPLLRFGTEIVDDETPFARRWGGWYVTGYRGAEPHRGNAFGTEDGDLNVAPTSNVRPHELSAFFAADDYLASTSDAVALLVWEHQMTVQNALTRASLRAQRMMAYQHGLQKAFHEPQTDEPAFDSVKSAFASAVEEVVDRLLFRHAAPLPDGIEGHAAFTAEFARHAPRSRAGHALKDLRLNAQLFAQRCSYLIYSDAFRALPAALKGPILDRLRTALTDDSPQSRYAYLPADERRRIFEILLETHADARAQWAKVAVPARRAPDSTP